MGDSPFRSVSGSGVRRVAQSAGGQLRCGPTASPTAAAIVGPLSLSTVKQKNIPGISRDMDECACASCGMSLYTLETASLEGSKKPRSL